MARFKITCCLNCEKRTPGCHGKCESYKAQRAEYDSTMAEISKRRKVRVDLNSSMYDSIERAHKCMHRKGR